MHGAVETVFPPCARRGGPCLSLQYGHAAEQIRLEADGWLLAVKHKVARGYIMVVRLLDAVEQGTAHKHNASRVLGDVGVAFDPSNRHRELHVYRVARTPRAAYLRVRAGRDPSVHRLAVHLYFSAFLAPGGDAEHQGELPFGFDVDIHPSIPRVARALAEPDSPVPVKLDGRSALRIEVYPDGAFRRTIEVAGQRGQEASHVGWATGASEPGLAAVGAVVGERVLVEVVWPSSETPGRTAL